MPHNHGIREQFLQPPEQIFQSVILLSGQRIRRATFFIQATFVTNADETSVERTAVGAYFQQLVVLFPNRF